MPDHRPRTWRTSARSGSLSVVLWAFGLATTLLLIGLWGRAVTFDQPTVEESARTAVDAEIASDRIYGWIADGLEGTSGIGQETANQIVASLREHPEIGVAVDGVVDEFVAVLFTEQGEDARIELTDSLAPVLPLVVSELESRDLPVDEAQLVDVLAEAEAIDLAAGEAAAVARVVDGARAVLSVVVVLAAMSLLILGLAAIGLSDDRLAMTRTLTTRIVLSALSFAVLFRVGSWVLDPDGGASPIAGSSSVLLGSNGHVFVVVAAIAAALAMSVGWFLWRRQQGTTIEIPSEPVDTDTIELVSV